MGTLAEVLLLGSAALGVPAVYFVTGYGCGDGEHRLARALSAEAVLEASPDGAGHVESYDECDDDDRFVVVGALYEYGTRGSASASASASASTSAATSASDSASEEAVLAHYRRAALADGWTPATSADGTPLPDCFTKPVGGTTAYFGVETPDRGRFHAEIVADRAGTEWR
ncbi:hypothetical protein ACIP6Q_14175 [Streptomyces bobili]|uniref:hypothetical protein n=1 Tax=Streptomyces bobili TaxID=67280 RepID=UPI00380D99C3